MTILKKLLQINILIFLLNFSFFRAEGQLESKCGCPPIKLYVYDTKIDFPLDSSYIKNGDGAYIGKYADLQNSGDMLENAYFKQQSDEFKVYKNLRPGATKGISYELPPPDKGNSDNGIDFSSYVEINRTQNHGTNSYKVFITINDVYRHVIAIIMDTSTNDLGQVDDLIDKMISENFPIINKLRDYQKGIRDASLSATDVAEHMWIGLKYQVVPEKTKLKVEQITKVHIKVFDCLDQKPAPDEQLNLKVGSPAVGIINLPGIKSNSQGEATVVFTAKSLGETSVFPDFTYTAVNSKSGYAALHCEDLKKIQVISDDRNYFILDKRPLLKLFEEKEPILAYSKASQDRAYYANGQWYIMVNGVRKTADSGSIMQQMGMLITVSQSDTGTYKWTIHGDCNSGLTPPCNTLNVFGTDESSFQYGSVSCTDCESDHCKLVPTDGTTTITVFDKKNKLIKGFFSGILVSPSHESTPVSGAFSVIMQ